MASVRLALGRGHRWRPRMLVGHASGSSRMSWMWPKAASNLAVDFSPNPPGCRPRCRQPAQVIGKAGGWDAPTLGKAVRGPGGFADAVNLGDAVAVQDLTQVFVEVAHASTSSAYRTVAVARASSASVAMDHTVTPAAVASVRSNCPAALDPCHRLFVACEHVVAK